MLSENEIEGIAAAYKEDGFLEGLEKGRAEGEAKGKAEEQARMAKAMKDMGYPIEDICKVTGLAPEVVLGL